MRRFWANVVFLFVMLGLAVAAWRGGQWLNWHYGYAIDTEDFIRKVVKPECLLPQVDRAVR
jgi:hypothetical protein